MVEFEGGEGDVRGVEYTYDEANQLIGRSEWFYDGSTEKSVFVYQDGQIVLQFHRENLGSSGIGDLETTDLANRYLWGPVVDQLLADEHVDDLFNAVDNDVLWSLTDHLGSVRDAVDSEGNLRLHRQFDAFGNIVDEAHYDAAGDPVAPGWFGYAALAFAFTGRPFDETTGLQNNLHRWYAPQIGRWMSEDPIGFAGGDANLYRYVGNQATSRTDPAGLLQYWGWGIEKGWPPESIVPPNWPYEPLHPPTMGPDPAGLTGPPPLPPGTIPPHLFDPPRPKSPLGPLGPLRDLADDLTKPRVSRGPFWASVDPGESWDGGLPRFDPTLSFGISIGGGGSSGLPAPLGPNPNQEDWQQDAEDIIDDWIEGLSQ